MRKIDKNPAPASFTDWKLANDTELQIRYETQKGSEIFEFLQDVKIREALENALLIEQGYICCYCGMAIERGKMAVEHFSPKSKHQKATFEYENLMASCKCSKNSFFSYKNPDFEHLDTIEKIAAHLGVSVETLVRENKGKDLIKLNKGDKIYFPNPPHCDDSKGGIDVALSENEIINPTKDTDCESKFYYKKDGKIAMHNVSETIENNVLNLKNAVLNLNAEPLCAKRKEIYNSATKFAQTILLQNPSLENIHKTIKSLDSTDKNGKRREFCFVRVFVLKSAIGTP